MKYINHIKKLYSEKHRHYHSYYNHIKPMLSRIEKLKIAEKDKSTLKIIALFHDVVYDPRRSDNEEKSVDFFNILSKENNFQDIEIIKRVILETKIGSTLTLNMSKEFHKLDYYNLYNGSVIELIQDNFMIFKEYQYLDSQSFKAGRIKFLNDFIIKSPFPIKDSQKKLLKELIVYISNWRPNIAVYAGSFNPLHKGHKNIIEQAERIFDKVIIACGKNKEKKYPKDRVELVKKQLPYHQVDEYEGVLTDYIIEKEKHCNVTLIRGIRNYSDFKYENTTCQYLKELHENLKILFIPCNNSLSHISSTSLRELLSYNKDISRYI